jgi:hypothetical protein
MDQAILDQVLYWLLLPFHVLHYLWTTVVFCISTALSWLHEVLVYFWTMVVFGVAVALSWLLIPLQVLCALPYLWLRAVFGVSIGLFFPGRPSGCWFACWGTSYCSLTRVWCLGHRRCRS